MGDFAEREQEEQVRRTATQAPILPIIGHQPLRGAIATVVLPHVTSPTRSADMTKKGQSRH